MMRSNTPVFFLHLGKWLWPICNLANTRLWSILGPDPKIGQCCPPPSLRSEVKWWTEIPGPALLTASLLRPLTVFSTRPCRRLCLPQLGGTTSEPDFKRKIRRDLSLSVSRLLCRLSLLHFAYSICWLLPWAMIPFTPVNSLPHLLGGGWGRTGGRAQEEREGRRKKKSNRIACCHLIWHQRLFVAVIISGIRGGGGGQHCEPLCQTRALKWLRLTNATLRLTSTSLFSSFISLSSISSLTVHQLSFEPPPMHYAFTNKEDVAADKQTGAPASPERLLRLHRHFSLLEKYTSRHAFSLPLSRCFTFHPYSLYI